MLIGVFVEKEMCKLAGKEQVLIPDCNVDY